MNEFQIRAEAYRQVLASNHKVDRKDLESMIKIYDFLGSLDEDELCMLYDSGAFNEITKAYCKQAMNDAGLERKQINLVMEELRWLLDTISAAQVTNR